MDILKILSALPHRYPFLLVDRVVEVVKGDHIHAYKNVTFNEEFFQGHFPGKPVMPGVLQLEAMAQAGALLAYEGAPFDPSQKVIYLMSFDAVKFRRPVVPGACAGAGRDEMAVDLFEDAGDGGLVEQVALVQLDAAAQVLDALKVLGAGAADDAADAVALLEQQVGEVRAVLSGNARDEGCRHGHSLTS